MGDKFRSGRKVTARVLCQRYNVVTRTIDRWTEDGILPPPEYINGIRYWDQDEIEECERERKRLQAEARRAKAALTDGASGTSRKLEQGGEEHASFLTSQVWKGAA